MELKTIRQISLDYSVSRRMLCYYEEIGLIKSSRKDDYAYRVYDENAIKRLQQIIILRKLQIPMKQIKDILNNQNAVVVIEIFKQNIIEIDEQITALSAVRSILTRFVDDLQEKADVHLKLDILNDKTMLAVVSALSFSENKIKENVSMEELNKANENLSKLEDKDVRIVYLPPMTVAAAYASGEDCEGKSAYMIAQFVIKSELLKIKPDARSFGFDCNVKSSGIEETPRGYEMWVSVPEDMEIPEPLVKRTFDGGLYAAHVLRTWDFADRGHLEKWVTDSEKYDSDWNSPRWILPESLVTQNFEETLNFYNFVQNGKMENLQLDILIPIREK